MWITAVNIIVWTLGNAGDQIVHAECPVPIQCKCCARCRSSFRMEMIMARLADESLIVIAFFKLDTLQFVDCN